jgi:hypothetical protein
VTLQMCISYHDVHAWQMSCTEDEAKPFLDTVRKYIKRASRMPPTRAMFGVHREEYQFTLCMDDQSGTQAEAPMHQAFGILFSHVKESWTALFRTAFAILRVDSLTDLVLDIQPMWDERDTKAAEPSELAEALYGMPALRYLTLLRSPTLVCVVFMALAMGNPPPCPALSTLRLLYSDVWHSDADPAAFEAMLEGLRVRGQRLELLEIDEKHGAVPLNQADRVGRLEKLIELVHRVVLP